MSLRPLAPNLARLVLLVSLVASAVTGVLVLPAPVAEAAPALDIVDSYSVDHLSCYFVDDQEPTTGCGGSLTSATHPAMAEPGTVEIWYLFSQEYTINAWRFVAPLNQAGGSNDHVVFLWLCNGTTSVIFSSSDFTSVGSSYHAVSPICVKGWIFGIGSGMNASTASWGGFEVDTVDPFTPTPTPTPSNTPTPTITPTPTPTIPSGPGSFPSHNHLINTDFNFAPRTPSAGWSDINRVLQAPLLGSDQPIEHMPSGSCGDKYWVMSDPLFAPGPNGEIYQDFTWNGGEMFINLEALTNSYTTAGRVTILNKGTGEEEALAPFVNGSFVWQSFRWQTASKPAGEYRFAVDYEDLGGVPNNRPAIAIDNVNVRRGYYGNDCNDDYLGQVPVPQQGTATLVATVTPVGIPDGTNRLNNCGFERGWSSWAHNSATRQFEVGGATGPTYAYLYTIYGNGSDPIDVDVPGHIWQPFQWPGGRMYVSYWTGPGTRVESSVRNLYTGSIYPMQPGGVPQITNGWTKRQYSFIVSDPGQYVVDFRSPTGQIAALDGVMVSSGSFGSGFCSSSLSNPDNNATATQHAVGSQVAATTQPPLVQTAHANQTAQATAYSGYLTQQYATMTQNAANTQTARPPQQTATRAAQLTATAQGTPVPSVTPTLNATQTCILHPELQICWVLPPVTVQPNPSDLTATALAAQQTQTQQAIAAQTQFVGIVQTAVARQTGTAIAAQTQTQAPIAAATQAARLAQTATAVFVQTEQSANAAATLHAMQTATAIAVGISAQQTQNALATQHAQQAAATQTAAALQTQINTDPNPATEAAATATSAAHATSAALVTATANAQRTADAIATLNAGATADAQATANSAATAVALATQHEQQAQQTATAAALQTELADSPDATAEAQATTTAEAHATSAAQTTATAIYQATVSAIQTQVTEGTQQPGSQDLPPVDDRPEPAPGVDCVRPTSPLQVANWIDYEVCRILTWFAWSPANTAQIENLELTCAAHYPCGLIVELQETWDVFIAWARTLPCVGGFCGEQPLTQFNVSARGILAGDFRFVNDGPSYSTECDLLMEPIVGPAIQTGACFCLNVLCALGILPWAQSLWNVLMALLLAMYVQRTWFAAAHT